MITTEVCILFQTCLLWPNNRQYPFHFSFGLQSSSLYGEIPTYKVYYRHKIRDMSTNMLSIEQGPKRRKKKKKKRNRKGPSRRMHQRLIVGLACVTWSAFIVYSDGGEKI